MKIYENATYENIVISDVLLKADIMNEIQFLEPKDFYNYEKGEIFGIEKKLWKERKPIDIITVSERKVGVLEYLTSALNEGMFTNNTVYYAKLIKELAIKRHLQEEVSKLLDDMDDLPLVQSKLKNLSIIENVGKAPTLQDAISMDDLQEMAKAKLFHTHFPTLNRATRLMTGELWSVVGDTSRGKTQLTLNIIEDVVQQGGMILYVALDMTPMQLLIRFISMKRGIPLSDLKPDYEHFYEYVTRELGEDYLKQIYFYDKSFIFEDVMSVASSIRPDLLVIDYVQNFETKERYTNEFTMLSNIMIRLQIAAHECPIIVLSQVSKGEGNEYMKRAKGSSTIAQASSLVLEVDRIEDEFRYCIRKNRTWGLTTGWIRLDSLYGVLKEMA